MKTSFQLQEGAVELPLPSRFEKGDRTDQIARLGIDLDFELVDLGADDDLGFRALEFGPEGEGVASDRECRRRRRIAQHRPTDQRNGVKVGHYELIAALEQRNQSWTSYLHERTEMKVSFFSCHNRYMKFSKSYLSSMKRQRK